MATDGIDAVAPVGVVVGMVAAIQLTVAVVVVVDEVFAAQLIVCGVAATVVLLTTGGTAGACGTT